MRYKNSNMRKVMGSNVKTQRLNRIICGLKTYLMDEYFFCDRTIQQKILTTIEEMHWELVKMDEIYYKFVSIEQDLSKLINSQITQGICNTSDIEYEDPNKLLVGLFDEFFWHIQRVLRYKIKFLKIVYPNLIDWENGEKRRDKLWSLTKSSNMSYNFKEYYLNMLTTHGKELNKYTKIRNSFEHTENEEHKFFEIIPFSLVNEDNEIRINFMKYKDSDENILCSCFMKRAFQNIYYHIEDFLELLFNLNSKQDLYIKRVFIEDDRKFENHEIYLKEVIYLTFSLQQCIEVFCFTKK